MKMIGLMYRDIDSQYPKIDEFWYHDLKEFIGDRKFVVLDSLFIPKELRNKQIGTALLDKFVSAYDEDTLIFSISGALKAEFETEPSEDMIKDVLMRLDDFHIERSFLDINKYSRSYEFKGIYVYGNKAGKEFYEEMKNFYTEGEE